MISNCKNDLGNKKGKFNNGEGFKSISYLKLRL